MSRGFAASDASTRDLLHSRRARRARDLRVGRAQRDWRGIGAAGRRAGHDRDNALAGRPRRRIRSAYPRARRDCLSGRAAQHADERHRGRAHRAPPRYRPTDLRDRRGTAIIGPSKALSLRTNLPQIAVPTTFAGSENAPFLSETERGARIARRGPSIRPRKSIVYDPELVAHLPPSVAGPSAMNAMANALDGLCAPNASPIDTLAAAEALRAISAALPRILANSGDNEAWSDALCGAWLAGVGVSAETFHSRLCQTLVDSFGLVHSEVNCLMLPYTAAYRRDAAPGAMRKAASALRTHDAPEALYDLMQLAAARKSLRQMDVHYQLKAGNGMRPCGGPRRAPFRRLPRRYSQDADRRIRSAAKARACPALARGPPGVALREYECRRTVADALSKPDPSLWRSASAARQSSARCSDRQSICPPDGDAKEYVFGRGTTVFSMFVARRGEKVQYGHLNICPHLLFAAQLSRGRVPEQRTRVPISRKRATSPSSASRTAMESKACS